MTRSTSTTVARAELRRHRHLQDQDLGPDQDRRSSGARPTRASTPAPASQRVGNNSCHDNNVLLNVGGTSTSYAMCAGGNGLAMFKFDLTKPVSEAGSVEKPTQLWTQQMPGVTTGHSGSFTYDGKYLHLRPRAGRRLGRALPGHQHDRRAHALLHRPADGPDQGRDAASAPAELAVRTAPGTTSTSCRPRPATTRRSVPTSRASRCSTSRTRPLRRRSPTPTRPRCRPTPPTTGIVLGGDWSTYWHNGTIYQSDIKRGVLSWQLNLGADATATQANSHLSQDQHGGAVEPADADGVLRA